MNGYNLTRAWYNYKFKDPKKVKGSHSDMFFYIIDLWNRLGQKKEFGLPTSVTMEALGIGSYNTYKKTLDDLFRFGFIKLISDSKNQHQSKIIAISKFEKATDEALDKATIKATDKATDEAIDEAIDTIIEQLNNRTIKQLNNTTREQLGTLHLFLKDKFENKKNDREKINYQEVIEFFNSVCVHLPQIQKLTPKRRSMINARAIDYDLETIGKVFKIVSISPFLNGDNNKNWKADFDWIMNPNNFTKILEGNYNGKPKQQTPNGQQGASDEFRRKTAERLGIIQPD